MLSSSRAPKELCTSSRPYIHNCSLLLSRHTLLPSHISGTDTHTQHMPQLLYLQPATESTVRRPQAATFTHLCPGWPTAVENTPKNVCSCFSYQQRSEIWSIYTFNTNHSFLIQSYLIIHFFQKRKCSYMSTSDFTSRCLHTNSSTKSQPKSVSSSVMEKHILKFPAPHLPNRAEKYWTVNLWSDEQWQCPYYLHMTLRSPKNTAFSCDSVNLVGGKKIL